MLTVKPVSQGSAALFTQAAALADSTDYFTNMFLPFLQNLMDNFSGRVNRKLRAFNTAKGIDAVQLQSQQGF